MSYRVNNNKEFLISLFHEISKEVDALWFDIEKAFNIICQKVQTELGRKNDHEANKLFESSAFNRLLGEIYSFTFKEIQTHEIVCTFEKLNDAVISNLKSHLALIYNFELLIIQILEGHYDQQATTKFLREAACIKDYRSINGCTLLYIAAIKDLDGLVRELIEDFQYDPDIPCTYQKNVALHIAGRKTCEYLIKRQTSVNVVNLGGVNPITVQKSVRNGNESFLQTLTEADLQNRSQANVYINQIKSMINPSRIVASGQTWQFFCNQQKKWIPFNNSDIQNIQDAFFKFNDNQQRRSGDSTRLINQEMEIDINFCEMTATRITSLGQYGQEIMSIRKIGRNQEPVLKIPIIWQIQYLDEDNNYQWFDIDNLSSNMKLTQSLQDQKLEKSFKIVCMFPLNIQQSIRLQKLQKPKSQTWESIVNLEEFVVTPKEHNIIANLRWIPKPIESDSLKQLDIDNEPEILSESDNQDDNDAQSFIHELKKLPQQADLSNPNQIVVQNAAHLKTKIIQTYPDTEALLIEHDGDLLVEKQVLEKINPILAVSELKFNDQFNQDSLVEVEKQKQITRYVQLGKAQLASIVHHLVFCNQPVLTEVKDKDLIIKATPEQMTAMRNNQIIQKLDEQNMDLKITKFYPRSFQYKQALQHKYEGINIVQIGQDLFIEGFVGIMNQIDTEIKSSLIIPPIKQHTLLNVAHLYFQIANQKINGINLLTVLDGKNLKVKATQEQLTILENLLPVLEKNYQLQKMHEQMVIQGQPNQINTQFQENSEVSLKILTRLNQITSQQQGDNSPPVTIISITKPDQTTHVELKGSETKLKPYMDELERIKNLKNDIIQLQGDCRKLQSEKILIKNKILNSKISRHIPRNRWGKFQSDYSKIYAEKLQQRMHEVQTTLEKLYLDFVVSGQQSEQLKIRLNPILQESQKAFDSYLSKTFHETFEQLLKAIFQEYNTVQLNCLMKEAEKQVLDHYLSKFKLELVEIIERKIGNKDYQIIPSEISQKLFQSELFIKAYHLNLPIFKELKTFIEMLEKNRIVLIKTATGSGKSTLIPPIMLALGYQKIIVTQPRRLPCSLICSRVQKTFFPDICGWKVAGASENSNAPLLYMTDGIAKETIGWMSENDPLPFDIIMIDEVHERGRNIDLLIAQMAERICLNKDYDKFKIILCSATLDDSIVNVFQNIRPAIFQPKLNTLAEIKQVIRNDIHPIALANDLQKQLKGDEQLLVFLPSQKEVYDAVRIFHDRYHKTAFPLLANLQTSLMTQSLIDGQVFFSTTISETSLTFKNLKFVIDSGKIRQQVYKESLDAMDLVESFAPKSTQAQRMGRLGRLKQTPGVYYICSDPALHTKSYHDSELGKLNLAETFYQLLRQKKNVKKVLDILQKIPGYENDIQKQVASAQQQLINLSFIDQRSSITPLGEKMLQLPLIGDHKICRVLYSALYENRCGLNIIIIASAIYVMGQNLYKLLDPNLVPKEFDSTNGDFETITNIFNAFLKLRNSQYIIKDFNCKDACKQLSVNHSLSSNINKIIKKIVSTQRMIEKHLGQSQNKQDQYLASKVNANWEPVGRSLLQGYYDQVFINEGEVGGNNYFYIRFTGDKNFRQEEQFTLVDFSKLASKKHHQPMIICFLLSFNSISAKIGNISIAGKINPDWLSHKVQRNLHLKDCPQDILSSGGEGILGRDKMLSKFYVDNPKIEPLFEDLNRPNQKIIRINQTAGIAFQGIKQLDSGLRQSYILDLQPIFNKKCNPNDPNADTIKKNFEKLKQSRFAIFYSLGTRYSRNWQVQLEFSPGKNSSLLKIKNAHLHHYHEIHGYMEKFLGWFVHCKVIMLEDRKVFPRKLNEADKKLKDIDVKLIERRISRVTNPELESFELQRYSKGDRTSRMELVAWILVNKFNCILEGGFVRDWIVGGRSYIPKQGFKLQVNPLNNRLDVIDESVSPKDLDVMLPNKDFDPNRFQAVLIQYGIQVDIDANDGWRYYAIFDKDTQPFTADLIQPYTQICHDMIDMDVSNLYVMKGFTAELGMKLPLNNLKRHGSNDQTKDITLEDIVLNIHNKVFTTLTANIQARIDKMVRRGWFQDPTTYEIKLQDTSNTICQEIISKADKNWLLVQDHMSKLVQGSNIKKVYYLSNSAWDGIFKGIRDLIMSKNNGKSNMKILFHGTSPAGSIGITQGNFENSYFKDGAWGYGAYFADDPNKSHAYTQPDQNNERVMFICKVLLGKQQVMNQAKNGLVAPDIGYDSVQGGGFQYQEYIVYKFGQAKPIYRVHYVA